jgi:hypothetical protein
MLLDPLQLDLRNVEMTPMMAIVQFLSMHRLSEFVDAFLVRGGQIYVKRGFSQVLVPWHELKSKEKDEAILTRSCDWSDDQIEEFLKDCSENADITQERSAVEAFADIARLKKTGNEEALRDYLERSQLHGDLRRICRVLAKVFQARHIHKGKRYLDIFKAR